MGYGQKDREQLQGFSVYMTFPEEIMSATVCQLFKGLLYLLDLKLGQKGGTWHLHLRKV